MGFQKAKRPLTNVLKVNKFQSQVRMIDEASRPTMREIHVRNFRNRVVFMFYRSIDLCRTVKTRGIMNNKFSPLKWIGENRSSARAMTIHEGREVAEERARTGNCSAVFQ
jgi:hypothetical protein